MNLTTLRKQIDQTDTKIVRLLAKRLKLAEQAAKLKKINNLPRTNKKRENTVLENTKKQAKKHSLRPSYIKDIFKRIIKESHIEEKEIMKK